MQEAFDRIKQTDPAARPILVPITSPEFAAHTGLQRVRIGAFTVPRGANWIVPNPVPMIAKLFSAAGVQLPVDSAIVLAKRSRPDDYPEYIARIPYSTFFDLTEVQQRDARNYQHILFTLSPLRVGSQIQAIRFRQEELLELYLESTATVNLAVAGTRLEFPVGVNNS